MIRWFARRFGGAGTQVSGNFELTAGLGAVCAAFASLTSHFRQSHSDVPSTPQAPRPQVAHAQYHALPPIPPVPRDTVDPLRLDVPGCAEATPIVASVTSAHRQMETNRGYG